MANNLTLSKKETRWFKVYIKSIRVIKPMTIFYFTVLYEFYFILKPTLQKHLSVKPCINDQMSKERQKFRTLWMLKPKLLFSCRILMTRRRFDVFDNGSVGSERGKAQESNMLRNSFFIFLGKSANQNFTKLTCRLRKNIVYLVLN